jgi:hypothetical protein
VLLLKVKLTQLGIKVAQDKIKGNHLFLKNNNTTALCKNECRCLAEGRMGIYGVAK